MAFDEDFEAELSENHEARFEVSMLAQSPDREFTEVNCTPAPMILETLGTRHIYYLPKLISIITGLFTRLFIS